MKFIRVLDPIFPVVWWVLRKTLGREVDGLCLVDLRLASKGEQVALRDHVRAALRTLRERDPQQYNHVIGTIKFVAAVGVPRPQVVLKRRAYFSPFTALDSSDPLWLACLLTYAAILIEETKTQLSRETARRTAAARSVELLGSSPAELELRSRLQEWQPVPPTA